MKAAKLGEICNPKQWKTISSDRLEFSGYPVYGANGVIGYYSEYNHTERTLLITCRGATCGTLNICEPFSYVTGNAMALDNLSSEVDLNYLYYYLTRRGLNDVITGSAQPQIVRKALENVEIKYPLLTEQRHIAAVLDKVSELISKRKAQLDKLDELVKSRFVEMFGDVKGNPHMWEKSTIGETIQTIESGWSGNGKQREKKAGEIAVLKVSAVTKGYFIPSECKVPDDQMKIEKYIFPHRGDLLFSRANTREMVGATAVINQDYPELILPDKLWRIRFSDKANVIYMKFVLSSKAIREEFSANSTGTSGSMYNVSMDKFKRITIPLPPKENQILFANYVEQIEKLKVSVQKSLDQLETLKKALMQKYFG